MAEAGLNPRHATTILRAFHERGVEDWDSLNLGWRVTRFLNELAGLRSKILLENQSTDGTVKIVLGMPHGGTVEGVLMLGFRADRAACCVSSQIGCAMGCDFCAST